MQPLPHLTLVLRIHGTARRAAKVLSELPHVGERPPHAEHVGRVDPGEDAQLERLVAVLGAPHVGRGHPEELALGVAAEAWQQGLLLAGALHPVVWKNSGMKLER